jgi:hypothetical protein
MAVYGSSLLLLRSFLDEPSLTEGYSGMGYAAVRDP